MVLPRSLRARIRLAKLLPLWRFMRQRIDEVHISQVAGNLTFTTLLAMVPMMTIMLAIFTTFPLFDTFRTSLEAYFIKSLMPKEISGTILRYLNMFAAKATRLSELGAVALLLTATGMMAIIERTFNHVWRIKPKRPIVQRVLMYWVVITLGPLLVGVSISATSHLFVATTDVVGRIPLSSSILSTLASVILTSAAYTLLYAVVPNGHVERRDAAVGGFVAGVAFEIAKRVFAVFISSVPTYKAIYGALAAFPIFILWIYISWMITLFGAVLVAALPIIRFERWWHIPAPADAFIDAVEILFVLQEARIRESKTNLTLTEIRMRIGLGYEEIGFLLERMQAAGWVGKLKHDHRPRLSKHFSADYHRWALIADLDQLRLCDVYRLFIFRTSGNTRLGEQVEDMIETHLSESLMAYAQRQMLTDDGIALP